MRKWTQALLLLLLSSQTSVGSTLNVDEIADGRAIARVTSPSIIPVESSIRLTLDISEPGILFATFQSSLQGRVELISGVTVSPNDQIVLPDQQNAYLASEIGAEGVFHFEIRDETGVTIEEIEHIVRPISRRTDALVEFDIGELASGDTYEVADLSFPISSNLIAERFPSLSILESARQSLERAEPDSGPTTRSADGARVFREYSRSVVLIVTDDSIGSGSIISESGLILTNWHVVEGYRTVAVILQPPLGQEVAESEIFLGEIVKVDELADLALLQGVALPNTRPIELGTIDDIQIGSDVHAIGHPQGEAWTYTAGTIGQVRANYTWTGGSNVEHRATVIQTQTPINPGNSGGPLLTNAGRLIGVNSFILEGADGLNYAVSLFDVEDFINRQGSREAEAICQLQFAGLAVPEVSGQVAAGDMDCDGRYDIFAVDEDYDDNIDVFLVDSDGDGSIESEVYKSEGGDDFDLWYIDTDGDGIWDITGLDTDGDWVPDKLRELSW